MIVLTKVSKTYDALKVLTDVSFRVEPKEFVCITGPSGAGKSTLISLLIGAEDVTGGSIEVDGVDLRKVPPSAMQIYRRRVGVVFQDYKLLQNRTVAENVAFPLEVCGAPASLIAKRVPEVLKKVSLLDRANAMPRELSGGEKARVAMARAIVHMPAIILADEPTGNLDPTQSLIILKLLREIHADGSTVVLATHDATLVDALRTRVIRLDRGRVIRDSVGGYDTPAHLKKKSHADPSMDDMTQDTHEKKSKDAVTVHGAPHRKGPHRKIKITPIGS